MNSEIDKTMLETGSGGDDDDDDDDNDDDDDDFFDEDDANLRVPRCERSQGCCTMNKKGRV